MTPEEAARFILSDCQDPELKAKCEAENDAYFAECMKDPEFKAAWEANLKAFADRIDAEIIERVYNDYVRVVEGRHNGPTEAVVDQQTAREVVAGRRELNADAQQPDMQVSSPASDTKPESPR